jgi:hypothetical protein
VAALLLKSDALQILRLATMWEAQNMRQFVITDLGRPNNLGPFEKINYGTQYHVKSWFIRGISDLVQRSTLILTSEEADSLAPGMLKDLYTCRELLLKRSGEALARLNRPRQVEIMFNWKVPLSHILEQEQIEVITEVFKDVIPSGTD